MKPAYNVLLHDWTYEAILPNVHLCTVAASSQKMISHWVNRESATFKLQNANIWKWLTALSLLVTYLPCSPICKGSSAFVETSLGNRSQWEDILRKTCYHKMNEWSLTTIVQKNFKMILWLFSPVWPNECLRQSFTLFLSLFCPSFRLVTEHDVEWNICRT